MSDNYLDRLLSDDEILKERDEFFSVEDGGAALFTYFFIGAILVTMVSVFWAFDPRESSGQTFYRECLEDKHTRTECKFMYDQMFK